MKKLLLISIMVIFVMGFFVANTYAVPSLGVATEYAYIGGTGQTGLEEYQDWFVDYLIPGTDENHGFLIGPSGSNLIVFTEYTDTPLWLLTNSAVYSANSPTVGGVSLVNQSAIVPEFDKKIDGYKPEPYFGVSLGTTNDTFNGYSWVELPEAFPGSQQFYALYLPLVYSDTIAESNYFFVATPPALIEGNHFSPKTDSAVGGNFPIPEPATMLLLGSGLIGMAGIGRKKFKK